MKEILAALDSNSFYYLEISDNVETQLNKAHAIIKDCPFEGELWFWEFAYCLNDKSYVACKIVIGKDYIYPLVQNFYIWENLLESNDNLLELPAVYVTRRFSILQDDAIKYLTEREWSLINTWEKVGKRK